VPAEEIERTIVAQVREIARRHDVREQVRAGVLGQEGAIAELRAARDSFQTQVAGLGAEAKRLLGAFAGGTSGGGKVIVSRIGEIEAEQDRLRFQAEEIETRLRGLADDQRKGEQLAQLLESFDEIWDALVLEERRELLHLVVQRVTIDPKADDVRIRLFDIGAPGGPAPHAPSMSEVRA